jgi:hypothetical protein
VISPAAPVAAPLAVRQRVTQVVDLQTALPHRFLDFSLYTRPPPADIAFS